MADARMVPQEILLPVRAGFIALTLVAALMLNLLPWSGAWLWLKPDFVALVVLYWCIEQPRKVGFVSAWMMGLIMDVADGTLLGEHALAYSILAYAGIVLHRRVRMFSGTPQAVH
ncbi:MAG: rod shape-determining protein MreD, partial [Gammaproteobacteria bacterium]